MTQLGSLISAPRITIFAISPLFFYFTRERKADKVGKKSRRVQYQSDTVIMYNKTTPIQLHLVPLYSTVTLTLEIFFRIIDEKEIGQTGKYSLLNCQDFSKTCRPCGTAHTTSYRLSFSIERGQPLSTSICNS